MDVVENERKSTRLRGMFRIYAHLHSLENFGRLYRREKQRDDLRTRQSR